MEQTEIDALGALIRSANSPKPRDLAQEVDVLRGSIKALQDEINQLNRLLLELSLNASVQLHKDPA